MNKNYFSDGVMRRMRQYTLALSNNAHSKDKDLEKLRSLKKTDEITQTVYEREVAKINQQIDEQRKRLLSEVRGDLMKTFEKMREVAKVQISKAPTAEMVNTLQLLEMLDRVTPKQFEIYAEQMTDCPLALQRLQQIADKYQVHVFSDDPEAKLKALDTLEGRLVNFLSGYDGIEEHCPYSVRDMYRYFRSDDQYMGGGNSPTDTEKVNERFWNEFVGMSSFKVFDDPDAAPGKPKAQYFFSDVSALSDFIKKMTAGVSGSTRDAIMSVMSQSAFQKNIDTVWSIFYGKNFYGMSDKTEITVTPAISPLGENSSPEELQQKYLAAVDWEDVSEET